MAEAHFLSIPRQVVNLSRRGHRLSSLPSVVQFLSCASRIRRAIKQITTRSVIALDALFMA